ncbi:DUF1501 domain-containing protein [Singulisphaera sp. Ch08]|uniref:DUF1501 domain-containing protein n=1 Tax=Singulisphaera sp. Ch08 TaxID=3120278 RepID=A0AAU7C676_9BACT
MIRFLAEMSTAGLTSTRREWLRIGGLMGLELARRATAALGRPVNASTNPGFGKAKSVIIIYANGGQSQLEMWDPKPDAPLEIRGEFRAIASSIPGVLLGEHLPRLARLADRYTILRSVSHDDLDHGSATYQALTGRAHPRKSSNPPPSPTDFPTLGALLKRVRPAGTFPYTAAHLNGPALVPVFEGPGQNAGFLGREYEPLLIGDVTAGASALPNLDLPSDLPSVRLNSRRTLLGSIDDALRRWNDDPTMREMNILYRQAYELLASPKCRQAFDLSAEPVGLRDQYGRDRSGQACLLARRLVEAGVPLVTVFFNQSARGQDKAPGVTDAYGWDTHNDIFESLKTHLLPRFDRSFATLLEDLEERGLLDETLVICMGEFGRAPRVALEASFAGQSPGRKHWANVYSVVLAGAGVSRGAVLGQSDRIAGHPVSDRVGPWDLTATILSSLGVDPAAEYTDPLNRPLPRTVGQPITGLYQG